MAFVPNPKVAQAILQFSQDGSILQNVLHFVGTINWTSPLLADLAALLVTWDEDYLEAVRSDTAILDQIIMKDLGDATNVGFIFPVGNPGTITSASLPANVTAVASLHTSLAGRSFRGRIYHVGLCDSQVTGSFLDVSPAEAIRARYAMLMADMAAVNDAALCVYSRVTGGADRIEGLATPVTSVTVDRPIDSQRRRLPGRGQ